MKFLYILHRYYRLSKFYAFLKDLTIKGTYIFLFLIGIFFLIDYYVIDINELLDILVVSYSTEVIFLISFISETFLGLIPPELFIAWSSKSTTPWLFVFILASLSYLGGIISYFIGLQLFRIPKIKNHIENNIAQHIKNIRKWGGFFVVVGAMLPLPHSIVSMGCGLIKYNFKNYLLFAIFRYLRFALYALAIFGIL